MPCSCTRSPAASRINIFGAVGESDVYRTTGLTGDPNHLGVMLIVPLLVLTPIYLRWSVDTGFVSRWLLCSVPAHCGCRLSRSGLLGLGIGFLAAAIPYRRQADDEEFVPVGAVAGVLMLVVLQRLDFFINAWWRRRRPTNRRRCISTYRFIPVVLHQHPLFGFGLNNFSVYFEFVTGRANWGRTRTTWR